ncbi:MAG TPA: hypothetical protein VLI54_01255 [Bacillota bacterium]|nr:hypothetical protein [Bacillota bacterium]
MYEVDQFTTPQAQEAFLGRYRAMLQAAETLQLRGATSDEIPALAFGGGAWTLQAIDGYVGDKPFDLDIVVPDAMFDRIGRSGQGYTGGLEKIPNGGFQGIIKPRPDVPLKVDVVTSEKLSRFFVGEAPYTGEANSSHVMTPLGFLAVSATEIAYGKAQHTSTRVRDLASVVKAQVTASHRGHPIIGDERWRLAVSLTIARLKNNELTIPAERKIFRLGPKYPSWLKQLIDADFDHQAFDGVPRF